MFGLGMGEIIIVLVLALILLGPQKLPEAAKQLGKGLREFRKATDDLKAQFETELYSDEQKARPTLVETPQADAAVSAGAPPGSVPTAPLTVPAATVENVPGLEAALIETAPPLQVAPSLGSSPPDAPRAADVAQKAS